MDGRDFCLYCGDSIARARDYDEEGRATETHIHMDHMNPVSLGGYDPFTYDLEIDGFTEDTSRNVVYCCSHCNLKKKDRPFIEWLKLLPALNQELARKVYIDKNGFAPEDFVTQDDIVYKFEIDTDTS